MVRQSVSLTKPNDDWLKARVESQEYMSKSEVVNDLIRRAREIEAVRGKLVEAEQGVLIDQTRAEILEEFKDEARRHGDL
ncbi:type II toxin-antitoxin system ParD family antitoxin [Pelagibacterium halotolerans]|uniref:ribbon-helix-helix domain-containing protein n=1 Tax=Pelagibacterium halotolerans TaxID=531813 RepID=UPI00384C555D